MSNTKIIPFASLQNGNLIPKRGIVNSAVTIPLFPARIPDSLRKMSRIKNLILQKDIQGALDELNFVDAKIGAC